MGLTIACRSRLHFLASEQHIGKESGDPGRDQYGRKHDHPMPEAEAAHTVGPWTGGLNPSTAQSTLRRPVLMHVRHGAEMLDENPTQIAEHSRAVQECKAELD